MEKQEVIKQIEIDFGYTKEELTNWEFIEIENSEYSKNVFWDSRGCYVLFAEDKIIWY